MHHTATVQPLGHHCHSPDDLQQALPHLGLQCKVLISWPYNVRQGCAMKDTSQTTSRRLRAARGAGAIYLAFVVIGAAGFLVVRATLFSEPSAIASTLNERPLMSGLIVFLELSIVLIQAVLALALYRLFRVVTPAAAMGVLTLGMVNAMALLSSAATLSAARHMAAHPTSAPDANIDATAQALVLLSDNIWETAGLFFGLWLVPLGIAVLKSGWMPAPLGWALTIGGAGKVISCLLTPLLDHASWVMTVLTVPQNIAEFWLVGYLLILGVRPRASQETSPVAPRA